MHVHVSIRVHAMYSVHTYVHVACTVCLNYIVTGYVARLFACINGNTNLYTCTYII